MKSFITTPIMLVLLLQSAIVVESGSLRYLGVTAATQRGVNDGWKALTGHNLTEKLVPPSAIYAEVEQDIKLDVGQFDIYQYPKLPARFAQEGLIRDLSTDVQNEKFQWGQISLSARQWLSEYDSKIWSVPLDTNSYLLYYRRDLIGVPPRTWEEYIELIKQYHDTDINGDGEKDFGACMNSNGQFADFAFTIATTVMKYKKGRRQGYVYDVNDDDTIPMKSLFKTKGWNYVFNLTKEISKYAEGQPTALQTAFGNFRNGRCATYIAFPSAGSQSVAAGAYIHGKLGVARAPGSRYVYDREQDELVTCTTEICPFIETGSVNHPSYLAGGIVLMINANSPNVQEALDYAAYATVNADVRLPGGLNPFRDSHFNLTWFEEKNWNRMDAEMFINANKLVLESPHTTISPQTPNFRIISTNVELALHELLGFPPHNKSSAEELPTVDEALSNLDRRISEETIADGYTFFDIENFHRRGADLPPLVLPTDPIIIHTSSDNDAVTIYTSIIVVIVALLIITAAVLLWQLLRRPHGIHNAPLDDSHPFGVIIVSSDAPTAALQHCAEESSCFLLHHVGSVTFVTKDVFNIALLLSKLDDLNQKALHVGVHFGKGTVVKPQKRNEEPRYGGRVVETAQELHAIACCLKETHGVLTVGEVQSLVMEQNRLTISPLTSSPRPGGEDSLSASATTFRGEVTFKNAGDKKFRGGIVRRICSVSCGTIRHPPSEDIHHACLAHSETETMKEQDDDDILNNSARYSMNATKTVYRRGSVLHVDCTRARTTAELFHYHDMIYSWVEHFGGEVDIASSVSAIATFGVHKANTLHEQNACRCALKLQDSIQTTFCVTSGSMRSSSTDKCSVASGLPMCTALLMNNHTAAVAGPSRIFVQHDVVFATAMPSLPHDVLQFVDNRGDIQTSFVVHELYSSEDFPFAKSSSSKVRSFKECFELIRSGKYLEAAEKIQTIQSDSQQCIRLAKLAQFLLDTEGDSGNGYSRRVVGVVKDLIVEDSLGNSAGASYNNSTGSDAVFFNLAAESNNSAGSGGSNSNNANDLQSVKKETVGERSRRTREEVQAALKTRTQTVVEDDGLISMFVSDTVGEDKQAEDDAQLELPTSVTDVTGVKWTRSGQQISAGAYAVVYRGISAVGRVVSLKCFDMESSKVHITPEEIASEVSTLSSYVHENIIGYITFGFVGRYCFIVMEHAAGGSLYHIVQDFGLLCHTTVKTYVREALRGIQYLHSQNVVHCDIKPHNILIGSDGICKIADFGSTIDLGFAAPSKDDEKLTIARGTAAYMAPEVCRGEEGPAGDMWSLGITIIELITGKTPWEKLGNVNHFIAKLGADEDMKPVIPYAELGEEIGELVKALLQRDPAQRPTAAQALAFPLFL